LFSVSQNAIIQMARSRKTFFVIRISSLSRVEISAL